MKKVICLTQDELDLYAYYAGQVSGEEIRFGVYNALKAQEEPAKIELSLIRKLENFFKPKQVK